MKKALVILSNNNKGKFISQGLSQALKEFSFFVYERKVYDLNIDEIYKIKPDTILTFWTDMTDKRQLTDFINKYDIKETIFIHCAEKKEDIPAELFDKDTHRIFYSDSREKEKRFKPCINAQNYKTRFKKFKYTITFAGNPATEEREKIMTEIIRNFGPVNIFCRSFDFYKSLEDIEKSNMLDKNHIELYKASYQGYVESQKELSQIYSESKINLDLEHDKYINYRCLEITASGGFLIAPYNETVTKYFEDGKDIETYKTTADLIDKINFYLKNLNLAGLIASRGRKTTASNHSCYYSLKEILKEIYGENTGN